MKKLEEMGIIEQEMYCQTLMMNSQTEILETVRRLEAEIGSLRQRFEGLLSRVRDLTPYLEGEPGQWAPGDSLVGMKGWGDKQAES